MFVAVRIAIGLLFFLVGGGKLLGHYQNFLYVIQSYDIFPPPMEELIARSLPWIEFFLGLFLILGLWMKVTLAGVLALFMGFLTVVGQALVRKLPLSECGCFGEWLSVPLPAIFGFDTVLLLLTLMMRVKLEKTSRFSLDGIFREQR